MSNTIEVKVPDIGDFSEVEVIEVLVAPGDTVAAEQSLITVESDKASMEIPSSHAGVVKSVMVKVGDKVKQGSVIVQLEAADAKEAGAAKPQAAQPPARQAAAPAVPPAAAEPAEADTRPESGGKPVTVTVPDIGGATDVEVIEIMVAVGDTVAAEQSLITVESDKASMEVPSSHAGVVTAVKVKLGDKVNQGSDIIELRSTGAAPAKAEPAQAKPAAAEPAQRAEPAAAPAVAAASEPPEAAPSSGGAPLASTPPERHSPTEAFAETDVPLRNLPHASPSVRKFARELGVNLASVRGSGAKNRITQDDVRQFVKQALAAGPGPAATMTAEGGGLNVLAWPKVDFAKFGEVEAKPLSRIKKISGANLHRNWVMIPHVTNNDQADITELEALRQALNKENEKSGIKVTMLAFLIKAVVAALKKYPEFNASLDGDNLVYKHYYHIGFAADTPNGLVVPVIRDADKKGIFELAKETAELAKLARDGKLSPSQMQGGCFSISSLGGIGGTDFTPIINAPEVAILGVSRSTHAPVWNGKKFVPRLMLPLSLSYDHRVIDGAAAARFNAYLGALLADFRRIAL
ncbi:dihydrolipoyllysine-residue acetyltransferase [Parapusillimonas granuli]|uniref:Acetyltransferase component of pyruvate dehydrogenase complex n=1 Tax=Parapusillimonas granuli TaxID=380911 RepID=A0A853FWX4_9BURK|nr:dihydrolipoyllysine-residue acetyltransferase [Parapusillimonas granuli]MBB5214114.1 pyruvate dehydrogenase E2 component (dihydrolipoamide acetyltransferase) [Parapusillimonas granuli]NYT50535.1 dihydrolipoyllysine-residue acetyltransferase [Parapusillimonas granuli]